MGQQLRLSRVMRESVPNLKKLGVQQPMPLQVRRGLAKKPMM
jgi:hypothetical protein